MTTTVESNERNHEGGGVRDLVRRDRPPTREEAALEVDAELIMAREQIRLEGDYTTIADIDCYWLLSPNFLDCTE